MGPVEEVYQRYRKHVERLGGPGALPLDYTAGPYVYVTIAVAAWAGRYDRRQTAIDQLEEPVRELLKRVALGRDAAVPQLPQLHGEEREIFSVIEANPHSTLPKLESPHPYGPSIRALWAEALAAGDTPPAAWQRLVDWGRRPVPPPGRRPGRNELESRVRWARNDEAAIPWRAQAGERAWALHLNDFPEQPLYTLLIDGEPRGDLNDWPAAWESAAQAAAAAERPPHLPPAVDPGRLLPRYLAGECEQVWADLMAIGPAVREPAFEPAARAVAAETMQRARRNVETLIARLQQLDYRFGESGDAGPDNPSLRLAMLGGVIEIPNPFAAAPPGLRGATHIFRPATKEDRAEVARLDRRRALPLSLRAWAEEVAIVDLTGRHPQLCHIEGDVGFRGVYADPLMVIADSGMWSEQASSEEPPFDAFLGYDAQGKAMLGSGDQIDGEHAMELPNAGADGLLKGERHQLTFVAYLRLAFVWGGFPGWEGVPDAPGELIRSLARGLEPI